MMPVRRRLPFGERRGPIGGKAVWIKEKARFSRQSFADVERRLVLQASVMSIEIVASGFARGPVAVMVQERGHALPQDISARECLQTSLRHGIFSIYTGQYLLVLPDVTLQHALGIRHFEAELLLDHIHSHG